MQELEGNIIFDLLFVKSKEATAIARYILESSKIFVVAMFVLSAIWEFFTNCNYKGLLIRTIFCLIIFSSYESFLNNSLKFSFSISEKIVAENSKNNPIINSFIKQNKSGESSWNKLKNIFNVPWEDSVSVILMLLVYLAFLAIKIIYSVTYSLLLIFIPIQAVFYIFPPTSGTIKGVFRTYLTLLSTPLVASVILIVLGEGVEKIQIKNIFSNPSTLQGLAQLLLSAILILYVPTFASALFDGKGVAAVSNKVAQRLASFLGPYGVVTIVSWASKLPTKVIKGTSNKLFKNKFMKKLFSNKNKLNKSKNSRSKNAKSGVGKKSIGKAQSTVKRSNHIKNEKIGQANQSKTSLDSGAKVRPSANSNLNKTQTKRPKNDRPTKSKTPAGRPKSGLHKKQEHSEQFKRRKFYRKMLKRNLAEVESIPEVTTTTRKKKAAKKIIKKVRRTNDQILRKNARQIQRK